MRHQQTQGFEHIKVLAEGSTRLRESFKENNLGLVQVFVQRPGSLLTQEYSIAYLLRNDEDGQVRLGVCIPQPRRIERDCFGWSSRQVWQVVAVSRNSIVKMQGLN